ncbi:MAG: hypothetical protein JWM77_1190 [Rhodospirillales bacterium]|nr:hypothetical protein [Rhodospirillales bacterium]
MPALAGCLLQPEAPEASIDGNSDGWMRLVWATSFRAPWGWFERGASVKAASMTRRTRPTLQRPMPWMAALVLLALCARLLVPAGLMPGGDTVRIAGLSFSICTSAGLVDAQHPVDNSDDAGRKADCVFASVGATSVPTPSALALPVAFAQPTTSVAPLLDLIPGRGLAAPPPRSHAPPALAS